MIKRILQVVPVVAFGVLAFQSMTGTVFAVDTSSAPEIDPASAASAITLLAGGGMLLVDRVLRKARAK